MFHAKDKQLWENKIPLSNSSRKKESISSFPINKNGDRGWGNASHDKWNGFSKELKKSQDLLNKTPFESIIHFL